MKKIQIANHKLVAKKYSAKVVGVNFDETKKIGGYFTFVFKLTGKRPPVKTITKFVSYRSKNGELSSYFTQFVKHFFPSQDPADFNPGQIFGETCFLTLSLVGMPLIKEITSE